MYAPITLSKSTLELLLKSLSEEDIVCMAHEYLLKKYGIQTTPGSTPDNVLQTQQELVYTVDYKTGKFTPDFTDG